MPIPSLQLKKKAPVSCREAKRLLKQLWSPRFVTSGTVIVSKTWSTGDWLCSQLCYVTAAKEWTVFEIELLARLGWKWGCQPFSCSCSQNVTHCRKETCSTWFDVFVSGFHSCHSFGKCQASTPDRKLKVAESGSTLHQLCIMLVLCLQKIPFLCRRFRICVLIELLATVGGKRGFQPFRCPYSQNVTLPKGDFFDVLV